MEYEENFENIYYENEQVENDFSYVDNKTENSTISNIDDNFTSNYSEKLELIHQDLGFICCFLVFFVLVILLRYTYKFFDMFFKY